MLSGRACLVFRRTARLAAEPVTGTGQT